MGRIAPEIMRGWNLALDVAVRPLSRRRRRLPYCSIPPEIEDLPSRSGPGFRAEGTPHAVASWAAIGSKLCSAFVNIWIGPIKTD
jgi:hypothetical protein